MRPAGLMPFAILVVAAIATQQSRAQEETSDVVMLPCDGKCATITRPLRRISGDTPTPVIDCVQDARCPEGFVKVQFTIRPDGHVADDISVLQVTAPPEFVESTKRALRTFLFEPALVDGQPVAVSHTMISSFGAHGETAVSDSVKDGYAEGVALVKAGKLDEAHAKLTEMLKQPLLNYFERGVIMYPLVIIAMKRQQYVEARNLSELALYFGPEHFSAAIYRSMFQFNISASLAMGDIVGAAKSLGVFKKWEHFDPADPLIDEVAEAQKKIDAMPSYGVNARIPDAVDGDGFNLFLYRRYFAFAKINGKLDRLTTACREQQVESTVSDKAEWGIPKNWSDCRIFVRGTPGTTFQIVQFSSAQSDNH